MDLSFPRFDKSVQVTALSPELALLMVGIAARQAASPTAVHHARLMASPVESTLFAPLHGAFNGPVARLIATWKQE